MSQGQGRSTPRKQEGLSILFRQGMRIVGRLPYPYWHLDLHAGSGWNWTAGCQGSPITFLDAADDVGKDYRAFFCDRDPVAIEELGGRVQFWVEPTDCSRIRVRCCDNAEVLREFAAAIEEEERPGLAVGSVLVDPNGWNERDVPFDELRAFFARFKRIDLILNVNFSLFARVRGCKGNCRTPGFDNWPDPRDVLGLKDLKQWWMVRNPPGGFTGDKFALFIGRNVSFGVERPFRDFFPINSPRGDEIVSKLKRTNGSQGDLFEGMK